MDKPKPTKVYIKQERLTMELEDGRTISVPVAWHPRLAYASAEDRAIYQVEDFGTFTSVHWPKINDDIRPQDLLAGRRSMESEASLQIWREAYNRGNVWVNVPTVPIDFEADDSMDEFDEDTRSVVVSKNNE